MKRTPGTDIRPTEVARLHIHIVRLLHDTRIKRAVGTGTEIRTVSLQTRTHIRHHLMKRPHDGINMPDEYPGIPIELITLHEHLRKLPGRLLDKSLYLTEVTLMLLGNLDIAIARLRIGRTDPHNEKISGMRGELHSLQHSLPELFRLQDHIVRRSDDDRSVRIDLLDHMRGIRDCRSGVPVLFLDNQTAFVHFRKHFQHNFLIIFMSGNINVFRKNDPLIPFVRLLYKSLSASEKIQELFRQRFSAIRPEPASGSASHDDTIKIIITHG